MTRHRNQIVISGLLIQLVILLACTTTPAEPLQEIIAQEPDPSQPRLVLPTATRIPLPSPTPTRTPFPTPTYQVTPLPTPVALEIEVLAAALNLRQGPGLSYPIVGIASAGDIFEVEAADEQGEWVQVVTEDGRPGWLAGRLPYTRWLNSSRDNVLVIAGTAAPLAAPASTQPVGAVADDRGLTGRLVLMSGSGGSLFVIDIDGSDPRLLAAGVIDPVVSPNGRQVAFTRWDGAQFGALYSMNIDGSGERVVLGEMRQPKSPTWSPDGQKIALSFQSGGLRDPVEICKSYRFGEQVRMPGPRVTITRFKLSDNGTIDLCYVPYEDLQWRLRQVDVASGTFEDLPSDEYSYNPAWDPLNPWRVIYDGNKGLVQVDVTNGLRWPISEDVRDSGPVFSPDGQKLALTYQQHDHQEVYILGLQTGTRQRLTKPPILADPQYNSASPAWSPDGAHIAFVTDRTGQWAVWVMDADGGNQRPLFPPAVQAQLGLEYRGVNERMLNWIE